MFTYKVVALKMKGFMGAITSPQAIEDEINKYAASGWVLDRIESAEVARMIGSADGILLIFRKPRS